MYVYIYIYMYIYIYYRDMPKKSTIVIINVMSKIQLGPRDLSQNPAGLEVFARVRHQGPGHFSRAKQKCAGIFIYMIERPLGTILINFRAFRRFKGLKGLT